MFYWLVFAGILLAVVLIARFFYRGTVEKSIKKACRAHDRNKLRLFAAQLAAYFRTWPGRMDLPRESIVPVGRHIVEILRLKVHSASALGCHGSGGPARIPANASRSDPKDATRTATCRSSHGSDRRHARAGR